jgi:hypothetical protein
MGLTGLSSTLFKSCFEPVIPAASILNSSNQIVEAMFAKSFIATRPQALNLSIASFI